MFSHEMDPWRISPGSPCGTMIPRGSPSILSPAIFQSCLCRNPAHSFCLSQASRAPQLRIDDAESSHPASLPPRGRSPASPPLCVDHCDHRDHCDSAHEGGGHGNFTSNAPEVTRTVPVAPVVVSGTRVKENVPLTLVAEMLRTVTVPEPPMPASASHCFGVSLRAFSKYFALVPLPSPTLRVATTAKKTNPTPVSSQLLPAIEIAGLPAIVAENATRPAMGSVFPAVQGDPSMVASKTPLLRSSQAGNPPEPDPSAPLGLAGLPLPPPPPQAASMRNRASENDLGVCAAETVRQL